MNQRNYLNKHIILNGEYMKAHFLPYVLG